MLFTGRAKAEMANLCPVAVEDSDWTKDAPDTVGGCNVRLLEQKKLCDVAFTFANTEEVIEAHQLFLRARSPVFDSMFRGRGSTGSDRVTMEISGPLTPTLFQTFLMFVYADKFEVNSVDEELDLLHLGYKYKIKALVQRCTNRLAKRCRKMVARQEHKNETVDAVQIFEAAKKYGNLELMELAMSVIVRSLGMLVSVSDPKLLAMHEDTLIYLLQQDELPLKETEMFEFVLKWGKSLNQICEDSNQDANDRLKKTLSRVLPHLRYTAMTAMEFTKVVVPTKLLPPDQVIDIYSYITGDDSTRKNLKDSLNLRFDPRKEKMKGEILYFHQLCPFSDTYRLLGTARLSECMWFYVNEPKPQLTSQALVMRPKITGVLLQWPKRRSSDGAERAGDGGSSMKNLKLRVSVMRFKDEEAKMENLDCKFETEVEESDVELQEIPVVPPMDLIYWMDYCIGVKDISLDVNEGNSVRPAFEYCWNTGERNFKEGEKVYQDKEYVELKGFSRSKELQGDYPEEDQHTPAVYTVRGIRVEFLTGTC